MRAQNLLRPVIGLLAIAGSATTIALATGSASASAPTPDTVTTTAPTVPSTMAVNTTVPLSGATVNDTTNAANTVLVTLSATSGSLEFSSTPTNVTLSTGYTYSGATIAFSGTSAHINAALANLEYVSPSTAAGVTITVTAANAASQEAAGATVAYDPQAQHYFEYVPLSSVSWLTAQKDSNTLYFNGQQGYLATIPTMQISSFIEAHVTAANVWAGGEAFDTPTQSGASAYPKDFGNAKVNSGDISNPGRVWIWADGEQQFTSSYSPDAFDSGYYGGPQAGQVITECTAISGSCKFTNEDQWGGTENDPLGWVDGDGSSNSKGAWNNALYNVGTSGNGEPNQTNFTASSADGVNNGEHYLELNAASTSYWNDLEDTSATSGSYQLAGYVVEFGDQVVGSSNSSSSSAGGTSATSNSIAVGGAPSTPSNVGATVGSGSGTANVTFTAPSTGAPFTGYTVTATPLQGGATVTQACSGSPCTVTGLTLGTSYSVTVQAMNSSGQSSPASPSTTVTIPNVPGPPTNLLATPSTTNSGQATVTFTAPASNGGAPITGYTVTATPAGGGTPITKSCTSSPCTLTGLTPGTTYTFTAAANNQEGSSIPSTGTTATAPTVPGPPTNVAVNPVSSTGGQAVLSFTAPSSNGGSPITGYVVKATPSGGGAVVTQSCASSPCTVTGLTNATAYTFAVSAVNAIGNSTPGSTTGTVTEVQTPVITSGGGTLQTTGSNGVTGATVKGTGVPGNTITVFVNGTAVGTTVVAGNGTWTLQLPGALSAGTYKITSVASQNGTTTGVSNQSTLTIQSLLPPPVFVSTPAKTITVDSASFVISEASATATLQCSIDGSAYQPCTSSFGIAGLTDGMHTLTTRAIDPTGLLSAPTSYSWNVQGVADVASSTSQKSVVIVMVSSRSTASAHGLQVACGSNGSLLRSCRIRAFYKGKIVGTVNRVIHSRLTYATAQIKPNKRGRRLLRRSGHKGFKLSIRATIQTRDNVPHVAKIVTREYKPFAPTVFTVKFVKNSTKITAKAKKSIRKSLSRLNNVRKMECHVPTYRVTVHNGHNALAEKRAKAMCKFMRGLGVSVKGTYVKSTRLTGRAVAKLKSRSKASQYAIASVTYWDLPHKKQ